MRMVIWPIKYSAFPNSRISNPQTFHLTCRRDFLAHYNDLLGVHLTVHSGHHCYWTCARGIIILSRCGNCSGQTKWLFLMHWLWLFIAWYGRVLKNPCRTVEPFKWYFHVLNVFIQNYIARRRVQFQWKLKNCRFSISQYIV